MNEQHPGSPPPMLKLQDILYVIFRHKWKILIISGLGIIATCVVYRFSPRMYESEAKLLIKYVMESKSPRQIANNDSQVQRVDSQGESIINTELQVLSSLDLAKDVATVMTPARILAQAGGGTNLEAAAFLIQNNIHTEVPKGSSVIRIRFQHPDVGLVRQVLAQIIASYITKHADVHSGGGGLESFLDTQKTALHDSLTATEARLLDAKQKANIISLDDSKKSYADQMAKLRQEILDAQAELTERQTQATELKKMLHLESTAGTNQVDSSKSVPVVPPAKVTEYRSVCRLLDNLRKMEDELLGQFTPESKRVKDVDAEVAANEKRKQQLEEENPGLVSIRPSEPARTGTDPLANARAELDSDNAKVKALEAKIQLLGQLLTNTMTDAAKLGSEEPAIAELQRQLALDEARYKYFYDNWQQSKADAQLGPGSISNITSIQEPSPPYLAASKMLKTMALILFGSIAAAFALAFALEFYLDPCLKRPAEVEAKLGVPLFLSIPLFRQNGHAGALGSGNRVPLLVENNEEKPSGNGAPLPARQESNGAEPPVALARESTGATGYSESQEIMRPFSDALRDRLISFFEIKNMTHKPKLVALTSCREGSGVSTVAAGLAASLSETGDGNVLLVDMNQQEGAAHHFYRGNPACLDDALTADKRDNALVQENLYVVAESSTGDNLTRALPRRFKNIVPKLKASDFDYIIFDLPPVNQISMTPRLARFMDVILMVIESETTDKEVLKKGIALLRESQPNIGTVLNKRRSYVPKRLQQEF